MSSFFSFLHPERAKRARPSFLCWPAWTRRIRGRDDSPLFPSFFSLQHHSLFPLSPHIHISLQSRCPSLSLLALSCCLLLACWVPVHLFWHTRLVNLFFPLRFFSCSNTGRQADRQTERQADRQTGTARLKATPFDRDAKASVAKSTN